MKIVIPYIDFKGQELKYCLRGIERFIPDPEITIIGALPAWIRNVTHIPFNDNLQNQFRSRNIYDKIMLIDHDFLFFNDDHFLLEHFSMDTYHYSGTIKDELKKFSQSHSYGKTLKNTLDAFGDIKNFDTHCPIFYKREILEKINVDWTKPQGYCIKSIYAHLAEIEGTEYQDLKIRNCLDGVTIKNMIRWRPYFSTGNGCLNKSMINVLEELYPEKSKYE